jgi:hypothetical protein
MVVADGNLSPKALKELFQRCEELKVPVFFEPTSVPKAGRVVEANAVQHLTFTSPNADELHAISASILKHSSAHARQKLYDKFPLDQKALESNLPQEKIIQIRNDILTGKKPPLSIVPNTYVLTYCFDSSVGNGSKRSIVPGRKACYPHNGKARCCRWKYQLYGFCKH